MNKIKNYSQLEALLLNGVCTIDRQTDMLGKIKILRFKVHIYEAYREMLVSTNIDK